MDCTVRTCPAYPGVSAPGDKAPLKIKQIFVARSVQSLAFPSEYTIVATVGTSQITLM